MAEWAARERAEGPPQWVTVQGGAENVTTPTLDGRDWSYTPPLQTPEPDSDQGGGKKSPTLDVVMKKAGGDLGRSGGNGSLLGQPSASAPRMMRIGVSLSLLLPARQRKERQSLRPRCLRRQDQQQDVTKTAWWSSEMKELWTQTCESPSMSEHHPPSNYPGGVGVTHFVRNQPPILQNGFFGHYKNGSAAQTPYKMAVPSPPLA